MVTRLLYLLLLPNLLSAQFLFTNLKPEDGLSSREARCTYTDSEGYVWIGTENGLNRYDGSHFRTWNHQHTEYPPSLGTAIYTILEHNNDELWFGTNSGAGIYSKSKNAFRELPVKTTHPVKSTVIKLLKDKSGTTWMATGRGLFIYAQSAFVNAAERYPHLKALDTALILQGSIAYDPVRDYLWVGTPKGLFCIDLHKQQLYSANNNPYRWPIFVQAQVLSIALNRSGSIAVSTLSDHGLLFYDFKTNHFEETPIINNNNLWNLKDGCNTLFYDSDNRLWISTHRYTSFIRLADGRFENIAYNRDMPYSIAYGFFYDAFQDKFGNIWLSTINGVSKLEPQNFLLNIIKSPTYPYFLSVEFGNINAFATDKAGNYWLGKMDGLVKYATPNKTFTHFSPTSNIYWNELFDLKWINNKLWCGSSHGIWILDPATGRFTAFGFKNDMERFSGPISWIREDQRGFVWFGIWNSGVFRFDPASKTCIQFNGSSPKWGDMNMKRSFACLETSDGHIWVSGSSDGVRIFDPKTEIFRGPVDPRLTNISVYSMADHNGGIWLSTPSKLLKCTYSGKVVDSVTETEGLPPYRLSDLCVDSKNRLWGVSREGLYCIDLGTNAVSKVNVKATFSFNDHWNSLVQQGDTLYAAMLDHLVVIDSRKYRQHQQPSAPLISGFRVFQDEKPFDKNKVIQLSFQQNHFSFDFSSPNHNDLPDLQYAYKLEGFDKDWNYCERNQTATYTNVPAGKYVFKVKSSEGTRNTGALITAISITVRPPFYQTWWFAGIVLLLLLVLAWQFYKWRKKVKLRRNVNTTIDYFANSIYGENSVNEICWDIARNCISQLQFEDCVVYLLDKETNKLVQKAAYGPKNPRGHEIINPIMIDIGKGIVGTVAETGKPLMIGDTTVDERYIVDDESRCSELAVPIMHDQQVIGIIDSEHSKKHFFTEDHLKALTTIASISANKIAEAQAEASVKHNELKLLEINKLLAESQLMALRAQMNPHFVFNCLNSIQECIVTEKYADASKYLNKFSKLFRMVLNNSGKDMVTVEEEIEVLQLYLELEKMRFEQSFSYAINIDPELDTDILVPSMLLQPYVENALWHGLMHKEGERQLRICFIKKDEDLFQCIIDDNGIGRKRSYALKQQQSKAKRHESKGLKISEDRLNVLQRQNNHARFEIIDKYDEDGTPTGTKVVVELSAFLKS
ncbi:GAF domain-containing protein [Segetibacter sp. 3557_3]|uniref:histidine kinase n=1 Tax=Segetibacter sp. 3557_3 TaxID=2547429 RepID=UPI001058B4F2|nr:histidine kinase [Segetibacter sp. 3557_3]TDH29228.1 GAF domain-containing protein [Segetibacter sp. 3557_3]